MNKIVPSSPRPSPPQGGEGELADGACLSAATKALGAAPALSIYVPPPPWRGRRGFGGGGCVSGARLLPTPRLRSPAGKGEWESRAFSEPPAPGARLPIGMSHPNVMRDSPGFGGTTGKSDIALGASPCPKGPAPRGGDLADRGRQALDRRPPAGLARSASSPLVPHPATMPRPPHALHRTMVRGISVAPPPHPGPLLPLGEERGSRLMEPASLRQPKRWG